MSSHHQSKWRRPRAFSPYRSLEFPRSLQSTALGDVSIEPACATSDRICPSNEGAIQRSIRRENIGPIRPVPACDAGGGTPHINLAKLFVFGETARANGSLPIPPGTFRALPSTGAIHCGLASSGACESGLLSARIRTRNRTGPTSQESVQVQVRGLRSRDQVHVGSRVADGVSQSKFRR